MTLKIIENRKIKSNKKDFDNFLQRFHENKKNFKIDCEKINADFFNSEAPVTIRHRKPARESIYYTEVFKEKDEAAYFFGLARDNVIASSNYLSQESHIVPILVANLHLEDSSKSNIVFARDSKEYNNVILLRIDCSQLNDVELAVLKNKNKITKLINGKGFINFGAIGDFKTIRNIRNFISNVQFAYENATYVKIIKVSIPMNYKSLKPDSNIVKDRFYNFNSISYDDECEDVLDPNESIENNEGTNFKYHNLDDSKNSVNFKYHNLNDSKNSVNHKSDSLINIESKGSNPVESEDSTGNFDSLLENSLSDSKINQYKYYFIDNNELFMEMSICKKDFFRNMEILNNLSIVSCTCSLDYIEVLDMDNELLNISLIFLIGSDESIKNIREHLNLNGFLERN